MPSPTVTARRAAGSAYILHRRRLVCHLSEHRDHLHRPNPPLEASACRPSAGTRSTLLSPSPTPPSFVISGAALFAAPRAPTISCGIPTSMHDAHALEHPQYDAHHRRRAHAAPPPARSAVALRGLCIPRCDVSPPSTAALRPAYTLPHSRHKPIAQHLPHAQHARRLSTIVTAFAPSCLTAAPVAHQPLREDAAAGRQRAIQPLEKHTGCAECLRARREQKRSASSIAAAAPPPTMSPTGKFSRPAVFEARNSGSSGALKLQGSPPPFDALRCLASGPYPCGPGFRMMPGHSSRCGMYTPQGVRSSL
ncbi:hypothetical protein DFH09DRAFT_1302101 [Mycena vulgaris]|nr:hypothetical protein DFH09DRAFT_1302101 [Mycena vulgaris]